MANFRAALVGVLRREGGLIDDPADAGGITKFGISLRAFPELGADGIRNLTESEASQIYHREYWSPLRLAELRSEAIATAVFDFAVHSGRRRAVIQAQRIVGVEDDGRLGPITLRELDRFQEREFVPRYLLDRVAYLSEISVRRGNRRFLLGWIRRVSDLDAEIRSRRRLL